MFLHILLLVERIYGGPPASGPALHLPGCSSWRSSEQRPDRAPWQYGRSGLCRFVRGGQAAGTDLTGGGSGGPAAWLSRSASASFCKGLTRSLHSAPLIFFAGAWRLCTNLSASAWWLSRCSASAFTLVWRSTEYFLRLTQACPGTHRRERRMRDGRGTLHLLLKSAGRGQGQATMQPLNTREPSPIRCTFLGE